MRFPRPLAIALLGTVGAVLLALVALPYLYRDRIEARLKTEIARSVNARVDWHGVDLSLLRDFPNVTLRLDRPAVVGVAPFAGDTLVSMARLRLVLDVGSVVRALRRSDRVVIREVALERPAVALRVLADGRTNWDITRPSSPSAAPSPSAIGVTLRGLRITEGRLSLDDRHANLSASIAGLDEALRGDFSSERFVLSTRTRMDSVSVRFAGIPYLSRARLEMNADVDADLRARRFTFRNDSIRLNQLVLTLAGSATLGAPNVALDLAFSSPGTSFGDILSLVPAVYTHDFAALRATGSMSASGTVKGAFGPHAFPAFALRAKVENGGFRYPSLPLPASNIALDLAVSNPGGDVDHTVVDLKRLHAVIGGRPLDARLLMRTPVSDPDVDLRLVGTVDLADVARTVKLDGVSQLSGIVAADLAMQARNSDVTAHRYERVAASGSLSASRIALRTAALPHPVAIDTASLHFTPRTAELTAFGAKVGATDLRATGALDNVLGFVLHGDELHGSATVASNSVDLNEWKSSDKTTTVVPVPPHVDFTLAASAARVAYGALTLANVHGGLHVKDQRITLSDLSMQTLRGTVIANGFYETTVPGRPTFDADLRLASVDIPSAFSAILTVQKLAPIARWAQGALSGTVGLKGPLGRDMTPIFTALTGKGAIETERLTMQGAPVFAKLADAVKIDRLRDPGVGSVKASFDVADGRVHVKPFAITVGGIDMQVAGSNGVDQSLAYDLSLAVPRALLGGAAGSAVGHLVEQAGHPVSDSSASGVRLGARIGGTVMSPTVTANFAGMVASSRQAVTSAVQQQLATRTADVKGKADSAARAQADRMVAEAEKQAAAIRAQARELAATTQREGNARADSLLARATNPMARIAAKAGTDRMRHEADAQAERIVKEADARADALVAAAKQKTDAAAPGATAKP